MRRSSPLILVTCMGCRAAAPEPPEPVDDRSWCEQQDHDSPLSAPPEPATAVLGFTSPDKEIVSGPIRESRWAVDECYERALVRDPDAKGRLSVRFVIEANGCVGEIEVVDDEFTDPSVGRCVIAVGKKHWRWPPRLGGDAITVIYPFAFSRG
ncbi:AgmX/PglI C-terminal domain-containing protein [Nannocystaceae bacterium ST9]